MFYTYVLILKNHKIYIGYTNDLKRKYYEHKNGKVKSTKNLRPLKLIYYEAYCTKKLALNREKYYKTSKGSKILKIRFRDIYSEIV